MNSSIAIIPARGGSKRIPRKNIKDFHGKPIIAYPIEAAVRSKCFSEVMVSTDDQEIADIAKSYGALVPFMRSGKNASDHAMTVPVLLEVLEEYERLGKIFSYGCCLYPTAVFASSELIIKGQQALFANNQIQSCFPIVRFGYPVQRGLRINGDQVEMVWPENLNARSQDLEPMFHDTGQFYWFRKDDLFKEQRLFMQNSIGIEIPDTEVQDLDTFVDWELAEVKYSRISSLNQKT
tara:strand:- start:9614 stop:10321 length:708 start_codon:yes stop_codon:yes gene_type:complete